MPDPAFENISAAFPFLSKNIPPPPTPPTAAVIAGIKAANGKKPHVSPYVFLISLFDFPYVF